MSNLSDLANSLTNEQIIKIMEGLGADRYQETADSIIFPTICHNVDPSEASMKLYYYPRTHTFHCYTDCGETFNIYEMFKKRYELMGISYDFYQDIVLKIGTPNNDWRHKENNFIKVYKSIYEKEECSTVVNLKHLNKGLLNSYDFHPIAEWRQDGISEEIMKYYNILYSVVENKIIIPHYDKDNNLIGIRGRALNEEDIKIGKYMPIQIGDKFMAHPLGYNLYGLNFVKNNIKKFKAAIVAESEKSCLQYGTMFGQNNNIVVASCGSSFHKYQLDLLLEAGAERVLIAYDNEGADAKEREEYYQKLKSICLKYKNYCTMGFVFDSMRLLDLKDSPFDKGPEVAKKLIQKGVWL